VNEFKEIVNHYTNPPVLILLFSLSKILRFYRHREGDFIEFATFRIEIKCFKRKSNLRLSKDKISHRKCAVNGFLKEII